MIFYDSINESKITTAVFIDFKKAFDTVDHTILIKKLDLIGVRNTSLNLLQNYLQHRKQKTLAN